MFWDTYVMAAGIKLAEENLGPMGRFHSVSDNSHLGVSLYTKNAGRFWFGDIDLPTEEDKLKEIAKGMKESLFVIPSLVGSDQRSFPEQAVMEISV